MIPKRNNTPKIIKTSCGSVQSLAISLKKSTIVEDRLLISLSIFGPQVCAERETLQMDDFFQVVLMSAVPESKCQSLHLYDSLLHILVANHLIRLLSIHPTSNPSSATYRPAYQRMFWVGNKI